MEWFRQLGRAIRNLARLAREQPIWAITALTLSPLALIRHLFRTAILFLIVGIVLAGGMQFVLASLLGLARDSNLYQLGMMLTFLVIILVTLRALFQPLILRYGGPAGDDTHGSARFATDRETRPLAQNGDGLLIGRDRKSGKPLRYAGPAPLLTIAPTPTGKGVGPPIPPLHHYPGPVACIDPHGTKAPTTPPTPPPPRPKWRRPAERPRPQIGQAAALCRPRPSSDDRADAHRQGRGHHHPQPARLSRPGRLHRPQGRERAYHRPLSRTLRPGPCPRSLRRNGHGRGRVQSIGSYRPCRPRSRRRLHDAGRRTGL